MSTDTATVIPDISEVAPHFRLSESNLLFHPENANETSPHPLQGLMEHGPYSRALLQSVLDPIRVAIISPHGGVAIVKRLLGELNAHHSPKERPAYLTEYPGFTRIFRVNLVCAPMTATIEFPSAFSAELNSAKMPYVVLAEKISRALASLANRRDEFDVVAIYLPDAWQEGFFGETKDDFDLHDYIKASMAWRGIPTQIIRETTIKYKCRCSVAWRLGIALYTKAGGVPWKLANGDPETAFIGLSYAVRDQQDRGPKYVTCCSQVFDSDGAGLEFVAYETDDIHVERENPFLSRAQMRRVMARSLALYQRRHAGLAPKRVVVHKSTHFKAEEVEGCFDALHSSHSIDLIQIQQDSGWRGVLINAPDVNARRKAEPNNYPVHRGTCVQLDGRTTLLWTQGNAPSAVGGKDYYKEGKGIPAPLLLRRFAGHGGWSEHCRSVLGLTKMNWNNDALYDRLPVTMAYAQVLARVIKRMPNLTPQTYQFRFFI